MKILILCPPFDRIGGVSNLYKSSSKFFTLDVDYFFTGNYLKKDLFSSLFKFVKDILIFRDKIKNESYSLISLNPSLDIKAIFRDFLFLLISKRFNKRVVFFIHGWDKTLEKIIEKYFKKIFISLLNKCELVVVLAKEFKDKLLSWGCTSNIELITTAVDDDLLLGFDIKSKPINNHLLFLSRIKKEKGIRIAVDAVDILSKTHNLVLRVVGDGPYLEDIQRYVSSNNIKNVVFCGNLTGKKKSLEFINSCIYVFPTSYGEGMPTTVLEAMAFGLPIITRRVGGLKDFFEDGKMGYITESKDPSVFAKLLKSLLDNPTKIKEMGEYNHAYAKEHLLASKVAKKMEEIYLSIV